MTTQDSSKTMTHAKSMPCMDLRTPAPQKERPLTMDDVKAFTAARSKKVSNRLARVMDHHLSLLSPNSKPRTGRRAQLELKGKLKTEKEAILREADDLKKEQDGLSALSRKLETANAALLVANDELKAEKNAMLKEKAQADERFVQLEKQHRDAILFVRELQKDIKTLRGKLQEEEADKQRALTANEAAAINELEAKYAAAINELDAKHAAEINEREEIETEMLRCQFLNNELKAEKNAMLKEKAQTDERFEQLEKQHRDAMCAREVQHASLEQQTNDSHAAAINELEAKHAAEINELEAKHAAAINELEAKHPAAINELDAKRAAEINEREEKHAAVLEERAEFIAELEKRLIDADQHVGQKEAYAKWFAASQEIAKLNDFVGVLQEKLKTLRGKLQEEEADKQRALTAKEAAVHAEEIAMKILKNQEQQSAKQDQQIAKQKQQIAELQRENTANAAMSDQAAVQKHAATNDADAAKIKDLQAKHAAEINELEETHDAVLEERAELISELEKRLLDADQHMVAQKEAYAKWFAASKEALKAADERIQKLEKFEHRTWDRRNTDPLPAKESTTGHSTELPPESDMIRIKSFPQAEPKPERPRRKSFILGNSTDTFLQVLEEKVFGA